MSEMLDHAPKYQCPDCRRGVLNRRVNHCLYCGAQLPASVLASPTEIAAAEASAERARNTYDISAPGPVVDAPIPDALGAAEIGLGIIGLF